MGTLPQMLQDRLILVQTGPLGFKLVVILFMAFLVSGDLPQTCLFYVFRVSRLIFFLTVPCSFLHNLPGPFSGFIAFVDQFEENWHRG